MKIRKAKQKDIPDILQLNKAAVPHVNDVSREELEKLLDIASDCVVVQDGDSIIAFMLTLRERASYDSLNYKFFNSHYRKFEYVDRIVVSADYRGKGLGKRLYNYLFTKKEVNIFTCEVNVKPANPGSLAFHEKMGFNEKSKLISEGGEKIVSLQVRSKIYK